MSDAVTPASSGSEQTQALLAALAAVLREEPRLRARCASAADDARLDELLERARTVAWRVLAQRLEQHRVAAELLSAQTQASLYAMRRELDAAQSLDDALEAARAVVAFVAKWITS